MDYLHKEGSVQLFGVLTEKDFEMIAWSKITWQMDYHNQGSVQLFCRLTEKDFETITWSNITWQMDYHNHQAYDHQNKQGVVQKLNCFWERIIQFINAFKLALIEQL
jgi:hypothetical protein